MASTLQAQLDALESLRGRTGSHYDLAKSVEAIGLAVDADGDDNRRSTIRLLGCSNPDGTDCVVGEIFGDEAAVIR